VDHDLSVAGKILLKAIPRRGEDGKIRVSHDDIKSVYYITYNKNNDATMLLSRCYDMYRSLYSQIN